MTALLTLSAVLMSLNTLAQPVWTIYTTANSNIGGNTVLALAADKHNNLWVGSDKGLCRFKGRTWTTTETLYSKLENQYINCLTVDRDDVLWIGTDDFGPIAFDGKEWKEFPKETRKLNMKLIHSIAIDVNDVKWISVTLNGLVRYDGHEWIKYTPDDSELASDFVLCTAIDRANRKWIGTNAGLCLYNGRSWTLFTPSNSPLPSKIVPAVAVDRDNVKWIGTDKGLCRFDGEQWQTYNSTNSSLPSDQITAMTIDPDGLLWIATAKGVAVFDRHDRWDKLTAANSPFPSEAKTQAITVDNHGTVWVGTDFYGLYSLSGYTLPEKSQPDTAASQATTAIVNGSEETPDTPASNTKPALEVKVVPFLDLGYITLKYNGGEKSTITFLDSNDKEVKTIEDYTSGKRISVNKLPKGRYTLKIATHKGQKTLKYNLK